MMVGLLRLCCAVGACVLAAGLLMGFGGAVAAADPDSGVSAAQGDDGTNHSVEQHSTGTPVGRSSRLAATFTRGMARIAQAVNHASSIPPSARKPINQPRGTDTQDETNDDSDLGAAILDPVAAVPNDITAGSDAVAQLSDPLAAVPNEVAPVSDPVAPLSVAGASVPNVAGPVSNVSALAQDVLNPIVGAVVPLTQLPSDLYSFLLGVAGVQPVVGGAEAVGGRGLSAAAAASLASRLPLDLPLAGISGPAPSLAGVSELPGTSDAIGVAKLDVMALGRASAASGLAPPKPDAAIPIRAGSSFRRIFGQSLLSVSLWALAAAALSGVGGLGFITLAGVRVGYRQAKAGVALRTTGIAHFARPGPLGIVRSGSLVAVHPRASRVVRPGALAADHLLDEVA
jgi:hypothetical protein